MWSVIPENEFQKFINSYPNLDEFKEEIILYKNNNNFILPKFTYLFYPHPSIYIFRDPNFISKDFPELTFTGSLRSEQIEMLAPFTNGFKLSNILFGCLKARPGAGKTVMGVYLACLIKKCTLILINNTGLADQWRDTILKMTNCTENDIGLIQADTFDVENKPFIIGMVQTFYSKVKRNLSEFYNKIKKVGIDFVLFDECHHSITGPKYALSSLVLNTKNLVGLSATPFVNGLHEFLMVNTVGNTISDSKRYDLKPKCIIVKFNSKLSSNYIQRIYHSGDMLKQRAVYNSIISSSSDYLNCVYELNKTLHNQGHRIINIVFTKKQVNDISNYLNERDIKNIEFYGEQRELNREDDHCLVATYKFAGEGFDYKELSALIIATPLSGKKSLIQTIGRILRSYPDKIQPVCYIMIDMALGKLFSKEIPKISRIIQDEFEIPVQIMEL